MENQIKDHIINMRNSDLIWLIDKEFSEEFSIKELNISDMQPRMKRLFSDLKPREYEILSLRLGLKDGNTLSFDEIGNIMGITRSRVHQIYHNAINKIRKNKSVKGLRTYASSDLDL